MYCPQCGQQQLANEMRFCSRCGFNLGVVNELISGDVVLQRVHAKSPLLRRMKALVGAKLMFFGAATLPFALLFSIIFDTPGPFAVPFILFILGIVQVLYVLLFGKTTHHEFGNMVVTNHATTELRASIAERPKLASRPDTSEIVTPASVTENTTKLLDSSS